jgi:hypothetical protein
MDRYTRGFILASLTYLSVGGLLGVHMRLFPESYAYLRYAHIHILLAGFMAMMIFGVGYFVLPRFASRGLKWPSLVAWHFWSANASLLALVIAEPMETISASPVWPVMAGAGAVVQALSFMLFTTNLGLTLTARAGERSAGTEQPRPEAAGPGRGQAVEGRPSPAMAPLGPGSPVTDFVDRKEGARELLVAAGLSPLRDPQHLEMVRARGVTLAHACSRHGIPLEAVMARLEALPDLPARGGGPEFSPDHIIGEVVGRYPVARDVLLRQFGEGCFTCPGFNTETLAQGAAMHGVEVQDLIADLRRAVAQRD